MFINILSLSVFIIRLVERFFHAKKTFLPLVKPEQINPSVEKVCITASRFFNPMCCA